MKELTIELVREERRINTSVKENTLCSMTGRHGENDRPSRKDAKFI